MVHGESNVKVHFIIAIDIKILFSCYVSQELYRLLRFINVNFSFLQSRKLTLS
jgi:hypothetical protein